MLLKDMKDEIIARSGQFLLPQSKLEVKDEQLRLLVQNTLRVYSKHRPYSFKTTIVSSNLQYVFSPAQTYLEDKNVVGAPDWVSDDVPQRLSGIGAVLQQQFFQRTRNMDPALEKQFWLWDYRKPTLTMLYIGNFDVTVVFYHRLTQSNDEIPQWEVKTITTERDDLFFKLMTAKFMQALGRVRRSFLITDIPIMTDAAELVSDGAQMEAEALAELEEDKKWWLAWS